MRNFRSFIMEEDGMGTVEIVLIILILVGLVIVFKSQITQTVERIVRNIDTKVQQAE